MSRDSCFVLTCCLFSYRWAHVCKQMNKVAHMCWQTWRFSLQTNETVNNQEVNSKWDVKCALILRPGQKTSKYSPKLQEGDHYLAQDFCLTVTQRIMLQSKYWRPICNPLEKEMVTHSSILAWEMPWTEEPSRLQSMWAQESWIWLSGTSQVALVVKNLPANAGNERRRFDPWVRRIPWRAWQPTLVFLPGESHGQRSLAGYSPQGCTRLKQLSTQAHTRLSV